jgi:3,4-dihydroxy 2-butanone 4-phosphate synthase/GTP cyclohydrolase II
MNKTVRHQLSTELLGEVDVIVPASWPEDYGLIMSVGDSGSSPLVRIQSRCAYGEVFGSRHCDCRSQLEVAASKLRARGGLLFYLEQEGRGAGIRAKASAYEASAAQNVDTLAHYESLGLPADPRDYAPVAQALNEMEVVSVHLLTNNPRKVEALSLAGINVVPTSLVVPFHDLAGDYLLAKRNRGHQIPSPRR